MCNSVRQMYVNIFPIMSPWGWGSLLSVWDCSPWVLLGAIQERWPLGGQRGKMLRRCRLLPPSMPTGFRSVRSIFILEFLGSLSQIETVSGVGAVLCGLRGLGASVLGCSLPSPDSLTQLELVLNTESAPAGEAWCRCVLGLPGPLRPGPLPYFHI